MGVFKMQRKAVTANTEYAFKFDVTGREFLVKNLTEGDIYAGFIAGEKNSEIVAERRHFRKRRFEFLPDVRRRE